jgi:hypothetical protein
MNEEFQKKVKEIRKLLSNREHKTKGKSKFDSSLICSVEDGYKNYSEEHWLEDILKKFHISNFYKKFIEDYVYYNNFFANSIQKEIMDGNVKVKLYFIGDNKKFYINEEENIKNFSNICIEINSETIKEDIDAIWSEVEEMQKTLIGYKKGRYKFPKSENFKIDKMIYKLRMEKKKKMKSEEIKKILLDKFDKRLTYNEIDKRFARFKAKINDI